MPEPTTRRAPRKDSFWFRHDSNASRDERIILLRSKFGWAGYGIYFAIIETLRESSDYSIANPKQMLSICLSTPLVELEPVITECVKLGLFAQDDAGRLTSPSLLRRMGQYDRVCKKRSAAGKLGGRPAKSKPKANGKQNESELIRLELNRSDQNRIELNRDLSTPPALVQYGKVLRMTTEEMAKVIEKYGKQLVDQELPEADLWLEKAQTPKARQYRKPEHNHYLFFRTTWLKDKKLEIGSSGFQKQFRTREQLISDAARKRFLENTKEVA